MNSVADMPITRDYQLLIFDWDGTLMDSETKIVACIKAAIRDVGAEPRDSKSIRNIIGLGLHEAVSALYPDSTQDFHLALAEHYRRHFLYEDQTASAMFAGARKMLASLQDAGHLLAVATGKGRAGLDKSLEETQCREYFHTTRCADETRSKPHPQMLLEIMDEAGIQPRHTLMIGDTEYDLQMATNAGVPSLAVAHGVHEKHRLLQHGPLDCVSGISSLSAWLGV
jgi:phosphoglycolate phosphatase